MFPNICTLLSRATMTGRPAGSLGVCHVIAAVGLDWESAPLEVRELFAIPSAEEAPLMRRLASLDGVRGCTLLKTCNRFELYLDLANDADVSAATAAVRSSVLDCDGGAAPDVELFELVGEDAWKRLMEISCGLKSQVLGEDQIITQVREAQGRARDAGCGTPGLETLFRIATTCGKAVRTRVSFRQEGTSCARSAVDLAARELGGLKGRRALVIGNGEMGRLAATYLVRMGARTDITLRTYRHGPTLVPAGCGAVPYDERLAYMGLSDVVVSATKSQHTTVTAEMVSSLEHAPKVLVDLALPRDIEPECGEVEGVSLFDLDDLRDGSEGDLNAEALADARAIIDEHIADYREWSLERARRLAASVA